MVKWTFPGSLYFEITRKNLKSNLVLVVVHESKGLYCLFEWKGEKENFPKSRQTFDVAAAQTSGPVNLVLSRQTGF